MFEDADARSSSDATVDDGVEPGPDASPPPDGPGADAAPEAPVDAVSEGAGGDGFPAARSGLPELVARTWTGYGNVGNCINIRAWYTFGVDGTVVQRDIDENACTRVPRLLGKNSGRYTLTGNVVEMTLDGLGVDYIYLGAAYPKETVTKRIERFPVVAAVIEPPWTGKGSLALDLEAFTSSDGAHFQSERYAFLEAGTGRLFEQRTLHSITIDPPLPLAAGTRCKVSIDFSLTSFDAAASPVSESGSFRVSYMAVIRATDAGWLRVMPQQVDGLPNEEANVAWTAILNAAGLDKQTDRFRNAFAMSYYLGHHVGDPRVLSLGLPQVARWYEATKPPPVQ